MRALLLFPLLLALTPPGSAGQDAPAPPLVRSIDVFGTDRIGAEEVRRLHGAELEWIARGMLGEEVPDLGDRYRRVLDGLRSSGDYSWLDVAVVQTFGDDGPAVHITVDVVERADSARRMDFAPPPTDSVAGGEALIEAWDAYVAAGMALLRAGRLEPPRGDCPVLHCLFGFEHPDLRPFAPRLVGLDGARLDTLARVLRGDARAERRAAAAYLLAHGDDAGRVVDALVPAVRDPDESVRNNALRVLIALAGREPPMPLPLDPFLTALEYPATTDRNKAAFVLLGLARRPEHRERILREAGPTLLRMLELEQPNNHDPAYLILRELSGRALDERDHEGWRRWWREATGGAASGSPG